GMANLKEATMQPAIENQPFRTIEDGDAARARRVRDGIRERSRELRARLPFLTRHQSALGLTLQLVALAGMAGSAVGYYTGTLGVAVTIALAAFFASIAHEIEHDLIHKCYYATQPRVVDALLALGWLMRPSTISPWVRRPLHLLHHKVSGTEVDIEERAITNGMPLGLRRLLVMTDGLVLGSVLRPVPPGTRAALVRRLAGAYWQLGFVHFGILYAWLGFHAAARFGVPVGHPATMPVVDFLFVVWVAPNVLRTFCLHFISSNMHYFGDIEAGNVL